MSVIATTARSAPGGTRLKDGYSTKIAFAADPDVEFWEVSVTPPGLDGGDAIDQTTMHNTTVMTKAAQSLYETTDGSATVAYDPLVYDSIRALVNVEGAITYHFPDGSTESEYGFLKSFTPNENSKGSRPEASITIVHTNAHPSTGDEVVGNYNSGTGTS